MTYHFPCSCHHVSLKKVDKSQLRLQGLEVVSYSQESVSVHRKLVQHAFCWPDTWEWRVQAKHGCGKVSPGRDAHSMMRCGEKHDSTTRVPQTPVSVMFGSKTDRIFDQHTAQAVPDKDYGPRRGFRIGVAVQMQSIEQLARVVGYFAFAGGTFDRSVVLK